MQDSFQNSFHFISHLVAGSEVDSLKIPLQVLQKKKKIYYYFQESEIYAQLGKQF